jgi:cell division protein FtsL
VLGTVLCFQVLGTAVLCFLVLTLFHSQQVSSLRDEISSLQKQIRDATQANESLKEQVGAHGG